MAVGSPGFVGRYVVFDEIASGGMATVYLGRSLEGPQRTVALKRLHPQYVKDPDFSVMFMDEARLALRLAHENIVQTLDVVLIGKEIILVLEYVHGASLSTLMGTTRRTRRRVLPGLAAGVLVGILKGLHSAHEARSELGEPLGVVHRDVSPQNVLVGLDGIPRIIDFGIAKAMGKIHATREGALKGKLAYMAPEQIRGADVTRRADLFAAAVMLWEALTGQGLFRAKNEAELMMKVLTQPIKSPRELVPELSLALEAVVMRGLERQPEDRFETALQMAEALEAATGPLASPLELGAWVEREATDSLAERGQVLDSIERAMSSPAIVEAWKKEASAIADAQLPPLSDSFRPTLAHADDADADAATRQLARPSSVPSAALPPRTPVLEGTPAERVAPVSVRAVRVAPARPYEPSPEERKRAALNARAGLVGTIGAVADTPRPYDGGVFPYDSRLSRRMPARRGSEGRGSNESVASKLAHPAMLVAVGLGISILDWLFRAQTASLAFRPAWVASAMLFGGLLLGAVRLATPRR